MKIFLSRLGNDFFKTQKLNFPDFAVFFKHGYNNANTKREIADPQPKVAPILEADVEEFVFDSVVVAAA